MPVINDELWPCNILVALDDYRAMIVVMNTFVLARGHSFIVQLKLL